MRRPRLLVVGLRVLLFSAVASGAAVLCLGQQSQSQSSASPQPQQPQQPIPPSVPPPTQPSGTAPSSTPESSSKGTKSKHAFDFLIRGTVFQPSGLAFPGIKLRIRRESEKKFRWETFTNSRGEFAVRVPQGLQYEVTVSAKGFAEQSRPVDARSGISEENVAIRLEPAAGGKKK